MQFRKDGKTMLVVSHSPGTLKALCNKAIWLEHGRLIGAGPVANVVDKYAGADTQVARR
jgi:ABC-type polysaccharide/polyol phosphate transport system ATPase subunit